MPNRTLTSFDIIELMKEEVEEGCPGVVSCADLFVLATRDGILLVGSPFYLVFKGKRDSIRSYYNKAIVEFPKHDDNITRMFCLFGFKGFGEEKTVSLLGVYNIEKNSCEFIRNHLYNFLEAA